VLAAASACGGGGGGDVCRGGWHVCGGQIRDADGRAVIMRGANLGDQKQAPYLDGFTAADYARLRTDFGLDAIRFVMPWAAVEPSAGYYDDAYLDQVRTRMGWAEDAGLFVVLDMHQDVYGEGFGFDGAPRWTCDDSYYAAFVPRTPWALSYQDPNVIACFDRLWTDADLGAHYAAAWRHVAERLGGSPAVIGFDIINEPSWGSASVWKFEPDLLAPFYQQVIAAVHQAAPGWLAFAEPSNARNLGIASSLPTLGPDVVYAPHAYDSQAEQGGGWSDARRADFLANIAALRGEADAMNAALWIGEYGGVASDPNIGGYLDAAYDGAAAASASTMLWDYSRGGYGLLDDTGAEVPAMAAAVARPYPSRIAGDPAGWTYDETTRTLTLTFTPDPSIAAPTEVIAPARVWPGGASVDCGGCTVDVAGDTISLGPITGAPAVVTIAPAP